MASPLRTGPADILTLPETAERLGLTTERVRQMVAGQLLASRGHGSFYLFFLKDVEEAAAHLDSLDADLDAARGRLGA